MINVDQIYQSMRELSSKGKGGYTDTAEFNRNSKRAELMLFRYKCSNMEATSLVAESMRPFLTDYGPVVIPSTGLVALPSNFGHRVNVRFMTAENNPIPGGPPITKERQIQWYEKVEEIATLESPVRGPNAAKGRYACALSAANKLQVYPKGAAGYLEMQYFRYPVYAVRGITADGANDEENYNAGTSTQYEWQEEEEGNLLDLIMYFQGLTIRDSQIIQWVQSHQASVPAIVPVT